MALRDNHKDVKGKRMLHWQNLNEKRSVREETITGSILRHGRAFWHFGKDRCLGWEWSLLPKRLSVSVGLGDYDCALSFSVYLFLFSFHVHLDHYQLENWIQKLTKRKDEKYGNGRRMGFHWTEGALFIHLWQDPMEWRSADPKWWQFNICPVDILLGSRKHSLEQLRTETAIVPMPEGNYPARITIQRRTWKRSRWPWPLVRLEADIEVDGGIPVPGKGENSWDCGEDAIMSTGSSTPTVAGAVSQMVKSVMETRERYGGKNWRPSVAA